MGFCEWQSTKEMSSLEKRIRLVALAAIVFL